MDDLSLPHFPPKVILVLWERSYKESHYTYHIHESPPGWLMALLRLVLVALFANNLHDTVERERSTLKKDFYQSFSIVCPFSNPICLHRDII